MKKLLSEYLVIAVCLTLACSGKVETQNINAPQNTNAAKKIEKTATQNAELQKQIDRIAAEAKGRVGVKAVVLETGASVALAAGENFPMQSVYKLPIGMTVLRQVDDGKLRLDQKIAVTKGDMVSAGQVSPLRDKNPNGAEITLEELLRLAVSESDGTASDVLLKTVGAEQVEKYLSEFGISGIAVLDSEKELARDWQVQYRNSATPGAAIELLRVLSEKRGLSAQSNALLMKFLTETKTKPKRLKGLLPKDALVAHKTGSSSSRNGITAAINDIGIINLPNGNHLAIAVFISDSKANEATREAVIAKIARAAWDEWSGGN